MKSGTDESELSNFEKVIITIMQKYVFILHRNLCIYSISREIKNPLIKSNINYHLSKF